VPCCIHSKPIGSSSALGPSFTFEAAEFELRNVIASFSSDPRSTQTLDRLPARLGDPHVQDF
jgi:hypothetical protein